MILGAVLTQNRLYASKGKSHWNESVECAWEMMADMHILTFRSLKLKENQEY